MIDIMSTEVTNYPGLVPVTVLQVEGSLDGSNYQALVARAQEMYAFGTRNLLLDLSKLNFLGSAGIIALHRVALLFRGKQLSGLDEGWAAFHSLDRDRDNGMQPHVKLLNPTKNVQETLEMVGLAKFFAISTDMNTAIASFQ
jgi:anti-anti-sigma regulatory factor